MMLSGPGGAPIEQGKFLNRAGRRCRRIDSPRLHGRSIAANAARQKYFVAQEPRTKTSKRGRRPQEGR